MTIKLSSNNINNLNFDAFSKLHKQIQTLAETRGFENFKAQVSNAWQVLKDLVTSKISWGEAKFYWSDGDICDLLSGEVKIIEKFNASDDAPMQQIIQKVKDTVKFCLKQEAFKNNKLLKESNENVNKISLKILIKKTPSPSTKPISSQKPESSEPETRQPISTVAKKNL